MSEKIYNLSTHFCEVNEVETEPRLEMLSNVKNTEEVIDKVKRGIVGVPKGSKVLLGGNNQYIGILIKLAKLMRWTVFYYSPHDNSIFTAAYLSREHIYEIEKQVIEETRNNYKK